MLLWKGIGQFIAARPNYRMLFGPVSISQDYNSVSRQLIVDFSGKASQRSELSIFVMGNNTSPGPYRKNRDLQVASRMVQDMHELSEFISDIEPDAKGVPILLKHYLKLGGEFLACSTDHNFSGVMDVLILVDLPRANPRALVRYMGRDKAARFLSHHHGRSLADCARLYHHAHRIDWRRMGGTKAGQSGRRSDMPKNVAWEQNGFERPVLVLMSCTVAHAFHLPQVANN